MLSVVIPTLNSERSLVPVLSALVPGVTDGLVRDVALVDGGSTDDTAVIADAAGCLFLCPGGDPGSRLRQAAATLRGDWLMFLSPCSLLADGWVREVAQFCAGAERRGQADTVAATFRLAVDGYGFGARLDAAMASARLALLGLPRPEQGLVLSRRFYERLGGHPAGGRPEQRLARRIGRRHIHALRAWVVLPSARA